MKADEVPIQGTVRRDRVALKLSFAGEDYGYAIDLGLPKPSQSAFSLDPEIKAEAVWAGEAMSRRNTFARRTGPTVQMLGPSGDWRLAMADLSVFDSMMTHAADRAGAPELLALRERMRGWRFYDHFRSDREAPARLPQIGTRTLALASNGVDLAAAIQTIREIGDHGAFEAAIDDAFPRSSIQIAEADGLFSVLMHQHGLLRPLSAGEISDGTLRYLLLTASLLTPRPLPLMVLNEPETSLHPDLIEPLARLVANASRRSQLIVVSHDANLVGALRSAGSRVLELVKEMGETVVPGIERPAWIWPKR
jgi:predicted ATPase